MALFADLGNIFGGIVQTIGLIGGIGILLLVWVVIYFYAIKFSRHVVIRERVGDDTSVYTTRGAIIKNKNRKRQELLILKTKLNPFKYWTLPLLPDKFYHKTQKGKKFLEFYKIGELDTDLKPIPPLNPHTLNFKPTDVKIFDWVTQGLEKDARETRNIPDKYAKWAQIGVPLIFVSALVFGFIYGLDTVKDLQASNVAISNNLAGWGDRVVAVEEARAGIQNIDPAVGDANEAVQILEGVGIELG